MHQFGLRQNFPPEPVNLDQVHKDDLRERNDRDWVAHHHQWIAIWNDRQNRIIQGTPFSRNDHLHDETPYMQWYINTLFVIYLHRQNLPTMRLFILQCCTSVYHTYLFMDITILFILQYVMSQEPSQPASQPYTSHVGSSSYFIHHPPPFFGQSPMGQGQMFGHSHPQFGNPPNTSC